MGDEGLVDAVLDDLEAAPIQESLRATLRMLGKLTLQPDQFGPKDVEEVRALRVSDDAIADAMYVCVLFNVIDRCSDALDFQLPEDFDPVKHGTALLTLGYSWIVGEPVAVPGPAAASGLV